MAASLVQSPGGNASSANSPTSLVMSWAATGAGNWLVIFASVTGSSPTISTPGGWTLLLSKTGTSISTYMFVLPNNAGGLTGVTLSCSATGGGISGAFMEFSGMPAANTTTYTNSFNGTGTAVPQLVTDTILNTDELCLAFVASDASASFSSAGQRTPEWVGNVNGIGSTNATTNTRNNDYWATNGSSSSTPQIQGTLNTSVVWSALAVRLKSSTSVPLGSLNQVIAVIGGIPGQLVGNFYQGMIGG